VTRTINVIGAGLAGVEAAWCLANFGLCVNLFEARPLWRSPAHKTDLFAELVCSNSLKSTEEGHATALLKEEMSALGSLVMDTARRFAVPAGKALAVDRMQFSSCITEKISNHPNIKVIHEEVKALPGGETVISSGPLTSPPLAGHLEGLFAGFGVGGSLYFYDAIAPIVEADSVDMGIAFRASRYDVGSKAEGDYLNCPMNKEEYEAFVAELLQAGKIKPHGFDDIKCFEGCQPIEVIAESHVDSLRHGPMKPMGLEHPKTGKRPYAVVQLRQEDLHGSIYNLVGFQTRMTYQEQDRVLRKIPGLLNAKFARYGSMHRNTYINGPLLLDAGLRLKKMPNVYVAGQLNGVEGYLESATTGIYAGLVCAREGGVSVPPPTTAIGALVNHVANADPNNYQPMKMMWGIFPQPDGFTSTRKGPKKELRRQMMIERAVRDFNEWVLPYRPVK
jgi:methylenetetrahydrofolate--tRNA-(uracil-5-)-methyltransferase